MAVKVIDVSRQKRPTEVVLHVAKGRRIRAIILPPGSSTGRHREAKSYHVHSLTGGTLKVEVFRTVRGKERKPEVKTHKLKPLQGYPRKVGRGVDINVTNKGRRFHVITKG